MLIKPSTQQAAWQEMEIIAFAHFGINTFTDREWGDGKESPQRFNPTALDAHQWVAALKQAGVKLLILTAKHHDGFCLWPSHYTDHSVKNSPYKNGKGDVVREVADACRKGRIKFGVYLSPWDRHEPTYGTDDYNRHFQHQLRELLTRYGQVTEVWFDGANGEGPNGKQQEYDWQGYYQTVRDCRPEALIAIMGPDIRWVGNEDGLARVDETSVQPANPLMHPGKTTVWYPAECDVSIRPGWFYHASQDSQVKSLPHLMEIYYKSVGRNAVLLLNVPPDQRGRLHENDCQRLAEFGQEIRRRFGKSLQETRGNGTTLELQFAKPARIDHLMLMENFREGERVQSWIAEGWNGAEWRTLCSGKIIGHKRIERFEPTEVQKVRLRVVEAIAEPQIKTMAVFNLQA